MEYELAISTSLESADTVLFPVGSLEQHGSEAPLGCDAIIARRLCGEAGKATGTPVLPCMPFGYSRCHEGFPGTFSVSSDLLAGLYSGILTAAARNGFRRCLIISGHGGNRTAGEQACAGDHGLLEARYLGWWQLPGAWELERELFPNSGHHVTATEVSMVWFLLGESPPGEFKGKYPSFRGMPDDPELYRRAYPEGGVGGDLSSVSVEKGRVMYEFLVRALCGVLTEGHG